MRKLVNQVVALDGSVNQIDRRTTLLEGEDLLRRILDLERRVTALDDPSRS